MQLHASWYVHTTGVWGGTRSLALALSLSQLGVLSIICFFLFLVDGARFEGS